MQHLKVKHRGINSIEALFFEDDDDEQQQKQSSKAAARSAVSLFDWMTNPVPNKVTHSFRTLCLRFCSPVHACLPVKQSELVAARYYICDHL